MRVMMPGRKPCGITFACRHFKKPDAHRRKTRLPPRLPVYTSRGILISRHNSGASEGNEEEEEEEGKDIRDT